MLSAVFVVNALLFLPLGLLLYFLPGSLLAVNPLWLLRVAAALVAAWGVQLLAGAWRPSAQAVTGLAAGNLLLVATLIPAALRTGMGGALQAGVLGLSGVLLLLAVLALLLPGRRG
ncbi:hypothetical protein [Deinococcus sonorensis]|uniref:Uncharacterized protein n=2 Tax=Deinococcus sonorensis TaxID=309891 RepID=A0AAU7UB22_9DEIO